MDKITTITVKGMTCNHCKANVEKNVLQIPGITAVEATPSANEVQLTGSGYSLQKVKDVINSIGYEAI